MYIFVNIFYKIFICYAWKTSFGIFIISGNQFV